MGTLLINEKEALILGGLFLQIKYGDYVKGRSVQPFSLFYLFIYLFYYLFILFYFIYLFIYF